MEPEIAAKKGPLTFFGIFQRERTMQWDIVLAASWMDDHDLLYRRRLGRSLAAKVGSPRMRMLSRLAGLNTKHPFVLAVRRATGAVEHGCVQIEPGEYDGIEFSDGYVFTS